MALQALVFDVAVTLAVLADLADTTLADLTDLHARAAAGQP